MCTMRWDLQQKITKNLRAIKKDIDAKDFIDIFIEKNVFEFSDQDEIMGFIHNTKENRNTCFITKLIQKDDSAYTLFIYALKELGYQHLADLLEDTKVDSPNQEAGVLNETASGKQDTKSVTRDTIGEKIRDVKTNDNKDNYSHDKEMLLSKMITLYEKKLTYIKTSALNDWVQAKLLDIYMPPNLTLMVKDKEKGFFKKTGTSIKKYSDLFLKDGTHTRNIFVQGEAGSGKSTILAIIVLDWIKTSKLVELIQTDEANAADSDARIKTTNFFTDLTTLKEYTFVFHVTLRDSGNELNILDMVKKQIIDEICTDKDERKNAYQLLNKIMKRERCLILLDGLDERTCNDGLPKLAVSHSRCSVLITTRPWKMTDGKITDSMIDTLLQLEGVNKPFEISRRLLGCRDDCKDSKTLDTKQSEFESYINKNNLSKFFISPMLLQLIVHSWVEGTEINGSICEIYSLFLESLLKKVNEKKRKFQSPRFQCFKDTEHIRPNNENVDRLAEAAFRLLFSNTRESSLVFSDTDLEQFELDEGERQEFALKSGILSKTRNVSGVRSSSAFSFIHKSIQEFLAAYYIACNTHLIDDIISGYLNRYEDAYMDISQVFIFLCGLDISAANKLSSMMNERDVESHNDEFSKIILSGYREAVANKHYDSNLKLSHFVFNILVTEIGDVYNIWIQNRSNVLSLFLLIQNVESQSSYERGESASHYEFDMSSCSKLKTLGLCGDGILLLDSSCLSMSEHPVWIVLNSAAPLPALPWIENINLWSVTISSRVLHSLLSSLLTLDHEVTCNLLECSITSSVQGSDTRTFLNVLNNTLQMAVHEDSPGLWETLHNLNIKSLSLFCFFHGVKHGELLSQSLSSLTQLETLSIQQHEDSPGLYEALWEALHSLNIKSLSLGILHGVKHGELLSQSLSSLTQLETLTIHLDKYIVIKPPPSLKYLNIILYTLLPSELRELTDTLRAFTQTIESMLEFGCAMLTYHHDNHDYGIQQIAPEEYIPIVQELETLENVAVKRFQILDRTRKNPRIALGEDTDVSCWSVRSNGNIDDDKQNGDNVKDEPYTMFVQYLHNKIIHRISMRLLITPASTSRLSNQYGCYT